MTDKANMYGQAVLVQQTHLRNYMSRLKPPEVLRRMPRKIKPHLVPYYEPSVPIYSRTITGTTEKPPVPHYEHHITETMEKLSLEKEFKLEVAQGRELLRIEDVSMYIITKELRTGLMAGKMRMKIMEISSIDDTFPNKICILVGNIWLYPLILKKSPTYMCKELKVVILPDPLTKNTIVISLSKFTPDNVCDLLMRNLQYFSKFEKIVVPPEANPRKVNKLFRSMKSTPTSIPLSTLCPLARAYCRKTGLEKELPKNVCSKNTLFEDSRRRIENVVHDFETEDNFNSRNIIPQRKFKLNKNFYGALKHTMEVLTSEVKNDLLDDAVRREKMSLVITEYHKADLYRNVELVSVYHDDHLAMTYPLDLFDKGLMCSYIYNIKTNKLFTEMIFLTHIEHMRLQTDENLCKHPW